MTLAVVTLAAGKGSRMKSDLPKVLHPLAGQPMLAHVLSSAAQLGDAKQHVVIGHGAEKVREQISGFDVSWAMQTEQKGTGHAVAQAMPEVDPEATVLVLYGDVPLIQTDTLQKLLDETHQGQNLALLTVELADPTGYGRIVRDAADNIQAIVEHKDATPEQHQIREVNTGILAVSARLLNEWLPKLSSNNAQGEYYLTDIIAMAVDHGVAVRAIHPRDEYEVQGVNDRLQLAELERVFQRQQADELMRQGVSLADPARIDIRGSVTVGSDVRIDVGCVFEGDVTLANGVHIGPYCVIKNAVLGAGTQVESHSLIDQATVAADCSVGPFARLRPGADLADGAKVGNFCEVKKSVIGKGSKVNHLTYIGDAEIGTNANIGAGTITCNYDGVNKFKTEIGDDAFIGSNSSLVAPVKVGAAATVAAGSVITKEVADGELAVARGKQRNISGWERPKKN
ncbi:bifunctional UDP-N-acetylglucosamine diphosphorylase/glucosamine-1-phosphate N-acetyltransferase GlmU [Bacterioplanoides sp. SCSIO 12839]|uniref:bifunctional UDP-N-acetylglucosamine diphosphorylase/glucosamine-1-phosphate N-acetyltransferase GlmU n=1 Tax=Bacterioplanoides sp. SCSIO 12839 TaxID=2829569 RepID=UPI002104BCAC|nr:bifunctional UDP-N-acetylglucosamine diphosphorylase/glucosamine-1-phosphate N-acetyltransferase GlmU [Bacterioplanoides sp. SCSIO 12839]UTW48378.1 bifunctional UDP-N-acetylglucosamine diphosphorylase/glucosamine-1-phosphate N-acetyltransferase GlmU [Bacterioplanoides sp. SCSIO 12839]